MDKQAKDRQAVADAIAAMQESDRVIVERLDRLIMQSAPGLLPRTWYGMPAYSNGDKIILFMRGREKFGEHFITLGFNDAAKLDDGAMWPVVFAIVELNAEVEAKVAALVRKAVGN